MASVDITPVQTFKGDWWAKREDLAANFGPDLPAGSKCRQYLAMAAKADPKWPMIVGCSAHSAMQIYVAAAAKQTGRRGVVYVPARAKITPATQWALDHGAEVNQVRPGYPSVYRRAARVRALTEGRCIRWNVASAIEDAAAQVVNLPAMCKRVVVPTGSGLTAAGIMVGLARLERSDVKVLAVAVSPLADEGKIESHYLLCTTDRCYKMPKLVVVRHPEKYETPVDDDDRAALPDGTPLDRYYAAKALEWVGECDCLWVPGRRPINMD